MNAVVFDCEPKFVHDYPVPVPGPSEALVRVKIAGICNTDLEIVKGYSEFRGILGHEFTGTVVHAPDESKHLVGERVVGEINCGCGTCEYCKSGLRAHCLARQAIGIRGKNGAFAQYIVLPCENLHRLPVVVSDREAVFIEPLAAACEIQEQIMVHPGQEILVLGDGKLGLLCALVLNLSGAGITLMGRHENKTRIAAEQGIRTLVLNGRQPKTKKKYDIVVEATGSSSGMETALDLVRPRGIVVLKTTTASRLRIDLTPVVVNEVSIVGSRCGPFRTAIDVVANKRIDVTPLITAVYPMKEIGRAFGKARRKGSLKVLIDCE